MQFDERLLAALTAFHPKMTAPDKISVMSLWIDVLEDSGIPLDIAEGALRKSLSTCDFMPKPSDIVKVINGTDAERATKAWSKVLSAVSYRGSPYCPIIFDDPKIHEAIHNLGGWIAYYDVVSHAKRVGDPWARKNFIEAYNACRGLNPKPLKGRGMDGRKIEPLLIGNVQACRKLIEQSRSKQIANTDNIIKSI